MCFDRLAILTAVPWFLGTGINETIVADKCADVALSMRAFGRVSMPPRAVEGACSRAGSPLFSVVVRLALVSVHARSSPFDIEFRT